MLDLTVPIAIGSVTARVASSRTACKSRDQSRFLRFGAGVQMAVEASTGWRPYGPQICRRPTSSATRCKADHPNSPPYCIRCEWPGSASSSLTAPQLLIVPSWWPSGGDFPVWRFIIPNRRSAERNAFLLVGEGELDAARRLDF